MGIVIGSQMRMLGAILEYKRAVIVWRLFDRWVMVTSPYPFSNSATSMLKPYHLDHHLQVLKRRQSETDASNDIKCKI